MNDLGKRIVNLSSEKRALLERHLLKKMTSFHVKNQIVPRRGTADPCVVSFAQQRLWFLDQLEPGSSAYNIPLAIRLSGSLNVAALKQSLVEIMRRHEILRTTFSTESEQPVQRTTPAAAFSLPESDLSDIPEEQRETKAKELATEEASLPFDLAAGPLLRATLVQLDPEDHVLLLTMHHIVSDGWSLGILYRELSVLYEAYSKEDQSPLPELPIQYADFALWQKEWLQGGVLEKQLMFWKDHLNGVSPLELPTDRPRPSVQTFHGATHAIEFPKGLTESLQKLSRKEGATLFMTLLAAFQSLLHRYTGQEDIVVGTPIANRNRAEIEGLIGFFVNTLVMRTDTSGNPVFRELLKQVKKAALDAYAHQDLPFEKLVEELQPERDMSRNPLFQVMFALQNVPFTSLEMPGLTLDRMKIDERKAKFDLDVSLLETAEGMQGSFVYNTDLFDADTIERMAGHYQRILEGIVENPDLRVSELPLLTDAERHQLVVEWNDTKAFHHKGKCIHELFEEQVERTPDAIAVVFEDQELTYRELCNKANQLAHFLRKEEVGPDVIVGICTERSLAMVVGILGILKAGGAYMPLDPTYPPERLAFMLEDAAVPVLLSQSSLLDKLPKHGGRTLCLDTLWEEIAQQGHESQVSETAATHLAYIIYTSGSTGRPKGVMIPHQAIVNHMLWMQSRFPLNGSDCVLQKTPFSFDASVWEFYAPLLVGGRLAIAKPNGHQDALYMSETITRHQVSVLQLVPTLLRILVESPEFKTCRSLRRVFCGGEVLTKDLSRKFFETLDAELNNLYGPTEVTIDSIFFTVPRDHQSDSIPIGRPVTNTHAYVLDSYCQPVPIGVTGELHLGGVQLARGYLNRPELTSARFIPNLFSNEPGARLYKTGDLARYLSDGNIEFLGRIDHQVKLRGFRIELGEIEAVLGQHPFVKEAIVIVREDQHANKRLVAYVVSREQATLGTNELRDFLKEKLPGYMVPSAFVVLDSLPLTPNGKVDRRALPDPRSERPDSGKEFVSPRTLIEELLAGFWCDVLGLKEVGIHDNFFELGGHSLLATQVMSRLRNAFHVEIPLRRLFERPTIAGLAKEIKEIQGTGEQPSGQMTPVSREKDLSLSFAQERLWFIDQLEPGSSAYNIPLALRLSGHLLVTALEQSFCEILRRHEVLRTTFIIENDEPLQRIAADAAFTLPFIDLSALPEEQKEAKARELAKDEASRPFDLSTGPLLRSTLLQLDSEEHVLLVTMHHIISDGWSMGIFYRELSALYKAFSQGSPSPLPDLPLQYVDFAVWQKEWLEGEVLEKQLMFWREQLNGISPLELPTDHPRPLVQTFHGATHTVEFPESLTEALRGLSRKEGATLFMTLLAAFQSLLHRYTGQEDIVVGTPIANRNHAEIEGLIGFFVNTLVMRTDTSGNPVFLEMLKQVRKSALDAYAHQDLPFEKLVEELHPERDLGRNPLFQVMFALQNVPPSSLDLSGLTLSRMGIDGTRTRVDLEVHLWEESERLRGSFVYNTDLFDPDTIARMAGHYQRILEGITANPDQRLSELPLLTDEERHQILMQWNDTKADYPKNKCIHELFEEQVERTPDAKAVVFEGQELTYRELNNRANQLAHYLRKLGVGPEVLVGVCTERSVEMILGVLGILKAGGAYVPLDPTYPKERLGFMIEDTRTPVILSQRHLLNMLPEHTANVICLDSDATTITKEGEENPSNETAADNLAYVIYTSGSTGKPKGVCVPHHAINRLVTNTNYVELESSDRIAQASNFSFDAATFEIWGSLLHGACLVGIKKNVILSPEDFAALLCDQKISVLFITTALFNQMARQMPTAFRPLRCLLFGGEKADPSCVRMVLEADPPRQLLHVYGPTESTTFTSWCAVEDVSAGARTIPIGKPVANTTAYLLDRALQPVPLGVSGELFIGGDGLARGYLNRPELTEEKFIQNPFSDEPGERLYKSGDLVRYLPDGNIEFLGRIDNQVKIRGYRIELGEIEAVLGKHQCVKEAIVITRKDESGDKSLTAYVVLKNKKSITHNELRKFLKEKLPQYMVPSAFVILDALPLNLNGKVDRSVLPIPHQCKPESTKTFVAPRNTLEVQLTLVWEKILNVRPIGVTDNFFELGGHSLLAVRVASEINKITKHKFTVMAVFQFPTIEQLAEVLTKEGCSVQFSSLVQIQPGNARLPFFWVHGQQTDALLPRYLDNSQPLYGLMHQGLDGRFRFTSLDDISAHYLKIICTVQPKGPYLLGGFCFGGVVALEMARKLLNQGDEVSLLFLLDPPENCFSPAILHNAAPVKNPSLQSRFVYHSGNLAGLPLGKKIGYTFRKLPYAFNFVIAPITKKAKKKIKLLICNVLRYLDCPLPLSLRSFYLKDIYRNAIQRYTPKLYQGRIILCHSDQMLYGEGVRHMIAGGAKVHQIIGADHQRILDETYVRKWAEHLNLYLRELQIRKKDTEE
jgi:amino acid adenylation domain-containing protein